MKHHSESKASNSTPASLRAHPQLPYDRRLAQMLAFEYLRSRVARGALQKIKPPAQASRPAQITPFGIAETKNRLCASHELPATTIASGIPPAPPAYLQAAARAGVIFLPRAAGALIRKPFWDRDRLVYI